MGNWFVALAVPAEPWLERIGLAPDGVSLFHPDDLHVTVAFLGPVARDAAEAAFALAPQWPTGPVEVSLGQIEAMGHPRRARSLSVIVEHGADVVASAMNVLRDRMLLAAGRPAEERAPLPHVTVARLERRATQTQRRLALEWARSVDLGKPRVTLSKLVLFSGSKPPPGRRYLPFAVRELG